MKNKNFTPTASAFIRYSYVVLFLLFTIGFGTKAFAQPGPGCPLSCNDLVHVSLNNNCEGIVTPEMIIEGEDDNIVCGYNIEKIVNQYNQIVGTSGPNGSWILYGNPADDYTGQILKATVGFDPSVNNTCEGYLILSDKMPPTLLCLDDVDVDCSYDEVAYLKGDTDAKYDRLATSPIVLGPGGIVEIPFDVNNIANQSEIIEFIQAQFVLSSGSLSNLQARFRRGFLSDPDMIENPNWKSSTFTDNDYPGYFRGMQTNDPNITRRWVILVRNTSATQTITISTAKLRIRSKGFLRIGQGLVASDNCDNVQINIISDVTTANPIICDEDYLWKRVIKYQATDWKGLKSPVCTHTIKMKHLSFDDLEWPRNHDGIDLPPLSCTGHYMIETQSGKFDLTDKVWDSNGDGYPQPEEIGGPLLGGKPIWPDMGYCMMNVLYRDEVHEICPGSFKILRKWIAYDMCMPGSSGCCDDDQNPREHYQLIKVLDLLPITFATYPPTNIFVVDAKPFECKADVTLPVPTIYDNRCTDGYDYTIGYKPRINNENCEDVPNGYYEYSYKISYKFVGGEKVYTIKDLPVGDNCVKYKLVDECGNESEGTLIVRVVDNTPPIAVCDHYTVATVGAECITRIYAETFDDGSFDNCTPYSELRFEVAKMIGAGTGPFGEFVEYGPNDVGKYHKVVMKVWDNNDNWNTCMVDVYIDDKIGPTIDCPKDITIDCRIDPYNVSLTGGEPTWWDNCGATLSDPVYTGSLDNCNTGILRRRWTVTDGGGRTATCTQKITVVNNKPFAMLPQWWPADVTDLVGCTNIDTDPSNTGEPDLSADDICSMVAATYKDRRFNVVTGGACYKILRDWTVIDWCQYNSSNPVPTQNPKNPYVGMWIHTQTIEVTDNNKPVFASCPTTKVIVPATNSDCTGDVLLQADATDDCTPVNELIWTYEVTGGDLLAPIKGYTNVFQRNNMPVGNYHIRWTVEDGCGNLAICSYAFEVRDAKNPTPLCISEITTVLMPQTDPRMVTIKASDFDRGSYDNCHPALECGECDTDLRWSFSGTNPNLTTLTFTESDAGLQTLEVWVWDVAGNRDYCLVTLHVQDNVNGLFNLVAGNINTETDEQMEDVNVSAMDLVGMESVMSKTDEHGLYQFEIPSDRSYRISAQKTGDFMNGLTTLDLVMIQKHILNIKKLANPYKLIAADANNDRKITATDILELRKLILGTANSLPASSDSWRFIDANYEFLNEDNPWQANDADMYGIVIENLNEHTAGNNFVAVKVGDVNNSVDLTGTGQLEPRNVFSMIYDNMIFSAGNTIEIPFYASMAENVEGLQFSLSFNNDILDLLDIQGNLIDISNANYAAYGNTINMSWNSAQGVELSKDDILFTLKFITKTNGYLNNQLSLDNRISAEIYNNELETYELTIESRNSESNEFAIYQNMPNPFSIITEISFTIPEAGEVKLSVYDVTGKVLLEKINTFAMGYNSVSVSRDDLNLANGVLYYKIEYGPYVAVRKMVLLAK